MKNGQHQKLLVYTFNAWGRRPFVATDLLSLGCKCKRMHGLCLLCSNFLFDYFDFDLFLIVVINLFAAN
jgi:hypothetical protein